METLRSDSPEAQLSWAFAQAAVSAGALIMDVYRRDFKMRQKADESPVCEADERSEELILAKLAKACPGVPVVAEESCAKGVVPELTGDFLLVDPLDGTREFASRNGEFTVNIAFIRAGVPVLGALYAPAFGRLWVAAGTGAYTCDVAPGEHVPPIGGMRAISVRKLQGAPVAAVSRSHRNAETEALMQRLGAQEMREAGSAMKFCLIAEGRADVYPRMGPTSEWDTAAAQAIVEVAGGQVVSAETGQPLRYNTRDSLLNPYFIVYGDASRDWLRYGPQ